MPKQMIECDEALILTDAQIRMLEPIFNLLNESNGGSIVASIYKNANKTKGLCFKFFPLELTEQMIALTNKFFEGENDEKS